MSVREWVHHRCSRWREGRNGDTITANTAQFWRKQVTELDGVDYVGSLPTGTVLVLGLVLTTPWTNYVMLLFPVPVDHSWTKYENFSNAGKSRYSSTYVVCRLKAGSCQVRRNVESNPTT